MRTTYKKSWNKGFSLMEIIITLAIIAAMSAVLVPSFLHVSEKAKYDRDLNQFEAITIAFKQSMTDEGVRHELKKKIDTTPFKIAAQIDDNGFIQLRSATVYGKEDELLGDMRLWKDVSSSIDLESTVESVDHIGKVIVFGLTPKTKNTSPKCEYVIVDEMGDVEGVTFN